LVTPVPDALRLAKQALEAGKHVRREAAAMRAVEMDELVQLADAATAC
jgi:hypothetical protein